MLRHPELVAVMGLPPFRESPATGRLVGNALPGLLAARGLGTAGMAVLVSGLSYTAPRPREP